MQAFSLIAFLVVVGGILLARPLRHVNRKLGDALRLIAHLTARLAIIVIAGWSAIQAVKHGTLPYIALGLLLLLIAAGAAVMSFTFLAALMRTLRGQAGNADS